MAIVYLNWKGTNEEFKTVCGIVKEIIASSKGVELEGLYVPTNDWNYAVTYKVETLEDFLAYQKVVRDKLRERNLAKIPNRKLELFIEPKTIGQ